MLAGGKHIPKAESAISVQGTLNLVAAAQQQGVKKIVLVSSIGTDDAFFPLNLFFGVGILSTSIMSNL